MTRSTTDYAKKTELDLQKKIAELRSRGQELNFKFAANQVRGVREARTVKKEIARLKTALRQKAISTKESK